MKQQEEECRAPRVNRQALVQETLKLRGKVYKLLLKAEADGDVKTALAGCREARACIELLDKLVDGPTFNGYIPGDKFLNAAE